MVANRFFKRRELNVFINGFFRKNFRLFWVPKKLNFPSLWIWHLYSKTSLGDQAYPFSEKQSRADSMNAGLWPLGFSEAFGQVYAYFECSLLTRLILGQIALWVGSSRTRRFGYRICHAASGCTQALNWHVSRRFFWKKEKKKTLNHSNYIPLWKR